MWISHSSVCLGVKHAAENARRSTPTSAIHDTQPLNKQMRFAFDDDESAIQPRWVKVNAGGVRVENLRQFEESTWRTVS
ncbi:MAG: hypothetical protein O2856_06305, partial [Planctomycetota bacterium]|nr:hypothetical protein [Planctomycetota bacterium]